MAVNIITSPTFEDAKAEILRKIALNNTKGSSHLVIVPDRHSLSYQRAVIEELGLVSVSNIEVASFSRLADLNITKDKRYLTPQSAVMLMRKVINQNKSNLLRYRLSSSNVGFADEMFAVVSDIRNSAITKDAILSKLSKINNVAIRNKVSDITLLYDGYIKELESRYFDATSKFGALIDIIDNIDIVKNSYVYVCDYYEFTNVELKLLEKIMTTTSDIYISLVEKKTGSNARIFPRLSGRIASMARANDLHVNFEHHDMTKGANSLIYDNLFGYVNDVKSEGAKPIMLSQAKNVEEELSFVASNIVKSVRERGLRYRDISIALSNIDGYKNVLEAVMRRYNIPYYIDDKVPVMSAPSVRHLLMAMDVVQNKYRRCDVVSYLMNGLTTDITNDEKDIFTNYIVKYNIDRTRFKSELTLHKDKEDIILINSIRERMMAGFDIIERNNVKQKMSLHIKGIEDYMDAMHYVDRINDFAKKQFDAGFKIESEITTQAPKKLFKFFEELLMVAGDEEMTQREFLDILLASLARVDIALIPKFNDCVYVGDIAKSRYDKVREMYFVGMTQGQVPLDGSVRGIMGQREVDVFATLGINLEPSPKEKNLLARFNVLELLMKASDKVYLSYPLEGEDGKVKTPSIVLKQLSDIYGMEIKPIGDIKDELDYMATYDNASYLTAGNYGRYSYAKLPVDTEDKKIAKFLKDEGKFIPFDYSDEERVGGIHDLYFGKFSDNAPYKMSASKIESYLKCPYKSYLQYVLGLKDREVADIKVAQIGEILHGILEQMFRDEIDKAPSDQGKLNDVELIDIVDKYIEKNCQDYDDKIQHEIRERAIHVVLKTYNMIRHTRYFPIEVEYEMRSRATHLGKEYKLHGFIDRIDALDDKCYLVDYKSSSNVDFNLSNIYYGDRVQLVMYATMYRQCTDKDITGLFYMPMPAGFKKVEDATDTFKFTGIVLSDDIANMPETIYPIKVKVLKSGTKIEGDGGRIVSREEFGMIENYVDRLIDNVISDIDEGYIAKNPLEGKCKYCDYRNICGLFGEDINGRHIGKVEMSAFAKEADDELE